MSRISTLVGTAALAALMAMGASALQAQSVTLPTPAPLAMQNVVEPSTSAATMTGPRVRTAGISRTAVTAGGASAIQGGPSRRDLSWMVVGGATLIVGGIVGGDGGQIIMITGAVIGLVGLWRFLQYS